jgi:hypothetical protein
VERREKVEETHELPPASGPRKRSSNEAGKVSLGMSGVKKPCVTRQNAVVGNVVCHQRRQR